MKIIKAIAGVFLSLVFLSAIFFVLQGAWSLSKNKDLFLGSFLNIPIIEEPALSEGEAPPLLPHRNWDIQDLDLQSESAVAVELSFSGSDKILFKKDSHKKLPIASLTKLMTAVVVVENYNPHDLIKVSKNAVYQEGVQGALKLGEPMEASDLLYIMLIESSNQAAYALSEGMADVPESLTLKSEKDITEEGEKEKFEIKAEYNQNFIALMNQKAKELGMQNTFFLDPTGLSAENVSTVEDLLELAKYVLKNHREIVIISAIKEYDLPNYGKLTNTDQLLNEMPQIIGSKTGFTEDAKGCLFLFFSSPQKNNYLTYVILGADDRFVEMKKMINWVSSAYQWR